MSLRKQRRIAITNLAKQAIRDHEITVPVGLGEHVARKIEKIQGKTPSKTREWKEVKGINDQAIQRKNRFWLWLIRLFTWKKRSR